MSEAGSDGARYTALVTGCHGVTGRAVFEHLHASNRWEVIGCSRRPEPALPGTQHICVDLADAATTRQALAGCAPTHLFFAAYLADHDRAKEAATNRALLVHALDGLAAANAPLERIVIYHGGKAYGAHLGPFKTPAKESDPPVQGPLLYHDQEQVLRERGADSGLGWTILRPDCVCGPAVGSPINLLVGLAVLGTLARERGMALDFPGTPESAGSLIQVTDSRLLGRASEWAVTAPAARDGIFNVTNGDAFRWADMWPVVAASFDVSVGRVSPCRLAELMPQCEKEWESLVARHDLDPVPFSALVDWTYMDAMLGMPYDLFTSTVKVRRAGFADCIDSAEMFTGLFDDLRQRRYIP